MGKIYVGQVDVEIKPDSKVALGSPTVLKVAYKKPDGTKGLWPLAGNANVVETTKAQYFTLADDLGILGDGVSAGLWTFQVYAELAGGFKGYGKELEVWIYDPTTA
jgi:hypothetical protein